MLNKKHPQLGSLTNLHFACLLPLYILLFDSGLVRARRQLIRNPGEAGTGAWPLNIITFLLPGTE